MDEREILFPHVLPFAPVTHMRSTLLQMSLAGLRERGHFDAWADRVPPSVRATILEAVGPQWIDIDVAFAHYFACDALNLPRTEVQTLGGLAGARMRNTFIGGILKMASEVGVTPFLPIKHVVRAWPRGFHGGSLQVARLGPKDCEFDVVGLSLAQIPYFRDAYLGLLRSAAELFGAKKAFTKVVRHGSDTLVMSVSWV